MNSLGILSFIPVDVIMIILAVFAFSAFVSLPWINLNKISKLEKEIKKLRLQLNPSSIETPKKDPVTVDKSVDPLKSRVPIKHLQEKKQTKAMSQISFNTFAQAQLQLWIGGISIILASLFLVQHTIENNLLSPQIRLLLTGVFALAVASIGLYIHKRHHQAYARMSQVLVGAGVAILYATILAASQIYGFIGLIPTLFLTVTLTVTTVGFAFYLGQPVALIGLLGGLCALMLTPVDVLAQLIMFYILTGGLFWIACTRSWTLCKRLCATLPLAYILTFLFENSVVLHSHILLIFMAINTITMILIHHRNDLSQHKYYLDLYIAILGFIGITAIISFLPALMLFDWFVLISLALATTILGLLKEQDFSMLPLISLVFTTGILFGASSDTWIFCSILTAIYVGYSSKGLCSVNYSPIKATILCASLLFYCLVLRWHYESILPPVGWGAFSLLVSAALTVPAYRVYKHSKQYKYADLLNKVFFIAVSLGVAIAILLALSLGNVPVGLSIQFAVTCILASKTGAKDLSYIAYALFVLFVFFYMPTLAELFFYMFDHLNKRSIVSVDMLRPVLLLVIPAISIGVGSVCLKDKHNISIIADWLCVTLVTFSIYTLYWVIASGFSNESVFMVSLQDRNIITNLMFIIALSCFAYGSHLNRSSYVDAGRLIGIAALTRIAVYDLSLTNDMIHGITILNTLVLTFLLPALWCFVIYQRYPNLKCSKFLECSMVLLLFLWVSYQVAFFFRGPVLPSISINDAELYSYSIAWLFFSIAIATLAKKLYMSFAQKVAGLFLALTILKVFFVDAATLSGLYRVASFLFLGITLIVIHWCYTKYLRKP